MNGGAATSPDSPDRKIRILHVVTSLEPGGLENGVVNLSNGLDPARFETSIACIERVGDFANRLNSGVEVHCLGKKAGFSWAAVVELGKLLRKIRPDVLHTHDLGPLIYGVLAKYRAGAASAVLHGEHAELRPEEKTLKRRWLRRFLYLACARVHTVSESLKKSLAQEGFSGSQIQAVLNGVNCEHFSPGRSVRDAREELKIPEAAVVMGIVGRFGAFKRHEFLISAFELLAAKRPEAFLLIVGDNGPEKENALRRCRDSDFRNRIVWAGFQLDTAPYYRAMDLLAIPSVNEGLSNAMLEAMACGVPCLTHPACGSSEVIENGKNGFIREMTTPAALAAEMGTLLERQEVLLEAGHRARKTAEESFSLEAMLKNYGDLYAGIVPRR